MTNYIPSSNITVVGNVYNPGFDEDVYIPIGISIASTNSYAINEAGAQTQVICDGSISGVFGVALNAQGFLRVGTTGSITGFGRGIESFAAGGMIFNDGRIFGGSNAIYTSAPFASVTSFELFNTGTIECGLSTGANANAAILVVSSLTSSVENSGLIRTLKKDSFAFLSQLTSVDTIVNTGTMIGKVDLGDGADRLDTSGGRIVGLISGGAGADSVIGSAFADTISGGAGADTLNGGAGVDTVTYATSAAGVTVNLTTGVHTGGDAAGDVLISIENIIGSNAANTLTGNSVANALSGAGGADKINGAGGNDVLSGGVGNDTFVFNSPLTSANVDRITDYSVAADLIQLDNAVFKNLAGTGTLSSSQFHTGSAAHDSNDRIIYNAATGALIYDSNGNAAGGAITFAQVSVGLSMTAGEFFII